MKNNKGFVVSAVLYPLLVLFLALIMGLLAMTDTRKRILDKMKLEISDSIFDEATCSCDTILNKLNYIIKNGVAGGGGGGGSYTYNVLGVNVKAYDAPASMPNVGNGIGDIAVITDVEIDSYYVSRTAPGSPKEGTVWIVQDKTSNYHITSDYSNIGISYVMQYINGKWELKKSYVYDNARWTLLYYAPLKDGIVDLTGTDLNAEIEKTYSYTGEYQTFTARFSGYYQIELWGAQGGHVSLGGKGAYTKGEIYLNAGEILYLYIGGTTTTPAGGWNGGGAGYNGSTGIGYGGGGSTDIRLVPTSEKNIWNEFDSLKSRIMVAAGGGGGETGASKSGGGGGDLVGITSASNYGASHTVTGGTQSMGGYSNLHPTLSLGGFGYGGTSSAAFHTQGGGGSGWYGGAGATYHYTGGGGGSSYISGHQGSSSIDETSTSTNIIHNGNKFHYSGYYFINTEMYSGVSTIMPTHDGKSTMTGNSGNGYAKIRLKTVEVKEESSVKDLEKDALTEWNYMYSGTTLNTGRYQVFDATKSGIYNIQLWGAQGGNTSLGGKGAYTSGDIYLNAGERLFLYVGSTTITLNGGWNGGGEGYNGSDWIGYGGGGATDIRLVKTSALSTWSEFESLKSRIMVAAGGGGGETNTAKTGGGGGSFIGITSNSNYGANYTVTGGTQAMGGYAKNNTSSSVGGFGYGGAASKSNHTQGGGGSGWYGGGGAAYHYTGGGGGSSYISGHQGCSSIDEASTSTNIVHNGSRYHYSDYYFANTKMYDGASSAMPTQDGKTQMTGNGGNGYAKITLKQETVKTTSEIKKIKNDNLTRWDYVYSGTNIYTGRYQIFDATKSGTYNIRLWGAQGGNTGLGGKGAYTSGEIYLNAGERLYLYVGGTTINTSRGWNGGGDGYNGYDYTGYGGGGATDIRTIKTSTLSTWNELDSLKTRIMVAAGGGGGETGQSKTGGDGGGLIGITSASHYGTGYTVTGGTQVAGGYANNNKTSSVGGFGTGANASKSNHTQGGGGSGWYGGGGAAYHYTGGGGGSSYVSGHAGCIAVNSSGKPLVQTYSKLSDSVSYTGYKFANTQMIDGEGYPWTTVKSNSSSGQPTANGTDTQVGQVESGYAKIIYLGA